MLPARDTNQWQIPTSKAVSTTAGTSSNTTDPASLFASTGPEATFHTIEVCKNLANPSANVTPQPSTNLTPYKTTGFDEGHLHHALPVWGLLLKENSTIDKTAKSIELPLKLVKIAPTNECSYNTTDRQMDLKGSGNGPSQRTGTDSWTWCPYGLPPIHPKDKLWVCRCSRRHQRTESSHQNMPKVLSHHGTVKRLPCQLSHQGGSLEICWANYDWHILPAMIQPTSVPPTKNKQVLSKWEAFTNLLWQLATLDGSIVLYPWKYMDHKSASIPIVTWTNKNFWSLNLCTSTYVLWVDDRLHVTLFTIPGLDHTARNTRQEAKPLVMCYQTGIVALPTSTCGANHLRWVVAFFGSRV